MADPASYFPQALFGSTSFGTPRVLIAPQRYVQGEGVLDETGRYLSLLGPARAGVLISRRGLQQEGRHLLASLEKAGIDAVVATFHGECSREEVALQVEALRGESPPVDCVVAVGGGKCVDAGKCVAHRLGVPLAVVPTLASNDAPCSALSVIYTPQGVMSDIEYFPANPALVVVDTGVVARAPKRYLVAGMGDAMATYYEAKVCLENENARTVVGARPTLGSCALGEICATTLYDFGTAALSSVAGQKVDDALERVVEANTLLSGVGFESGGLAIAHSVAQGYTAVPVVHANYMHGEMVAMGLLTQLVAEGDRKEARRVARFFASVGLPVNLAQISLGADRTADLDAMIEVAMAFPLLQNMPFEVTAAGLRDAAMDADRLGAEVAAAEGDAAYRELQGESG
jgi:glycerol dehydrogenase